MCDCPLNHRLEPTDGKGLGKNNIGKVGRTSPGSKVCALVSSKVHLSHVNVHQTVTLSEKFYQADKPAHSVGSQPPPSLSLPKGT